MNKYMRDHLNHKSMGCKKCEQTRKALLRYFFHTWEKCEINIDEKIAGESCAITDIILSAIGEWVVEIADKNQGSAIKLSKIISKKIKERVEYLRSTCYDGDIIQ